ncbi:MAG: neutral zinc metallopeptidase [Planctomycetaceae bacterium]|nr:neutral zinc metallopeptidase [Planctomycetaceae bacterium]
MRWENLPGSDNVEDRRGQRTGRGGGGGGLAIGGTGGILLVVVVLVAGFYGVDLSGLLGGGAIDGPTTTQSAPYNPTPDEQNMAQFTSAALKTTEETWGSIFQQMGRQYRPPRLVLYSGVTQTSCGYGQSAMGPFYCPDDQTVYIDLSFYEDMKKRMGGGGDFAQGYVLAHEVGHHIQHLFGIDQQVRSLQARADKRESNQLSVMLELQADCYAGVWGQAMEREGILDPGDLEQALNTAEAIGDDRLQRQTQGRVVPDSFTHGTSQQRYYWFKRGFDSGDPGQCNTFASSQ